jgi:site-specific DNA-methyltransferase (adenine-specific)
MKEISPFLDLRLADCMDVMREYPDGHFDLAIVDPPYGIGVDLTMAKQSGTHYGKAAAPKGIYKASGWDSATPETQYFDELRRVSKNQVIWGANHMIDKIAVSSPCWIVWDKLNGSNNFADCELAWTSFKTAVRKFSFMWNGMIQGDMAKKETRIHPTQKPVKLYEWLLANYAKPGDRILDTHLGSGSIAIACHYRQHHLTACEIDPDYYAAAMERIEAETRQLTLFEPSTTPPLHHSITPPPPLL